MIILHIKLHHSALIYSKEQCNKRQYSEVIYTQQYGKVQFEEQYSTRSTVV